jgi:hypothetical protein
MRSVKSPAPERRIKEVRQKENMRMKLFYIASAVSMCIFLCSCGSPPKAEVTSVIDSGTTASPQAMTVVSDLGKNFGQKFRAAFDDKFRELAGQSGRPVEFMRFIEFIRSPYNKPDANVLFPDHLFVFVSTRGTSSDGYNVTSVDYMLEVKFLSREPFLVQKIHLNTGRPYIDTDQQRGAELARAIAEELKKRKIL